MVSARSLARVERSLLDGVPAVVQDLGACVRVDEALKVIVHAVVDVLGFGAAAINVTTPDGDLRVDAVVGPAGVDELLGSRHPIEVWREILSAAEAWGELRFFSHDRDQTLVERFPNWTPTGPVGPEPDAWHPEDSMLAPLWDEQGQLVAVLSVDEPRAGRLPDLEQRTVLEVFAGQAAKAIRDAQAREEADAVRRDVESRWRLAFEHSRRAAAHPQPRPHPTRPLLVPASRTGPPATTTPAPGQTCSSGRFGWRRRAQPTPPAWTRSCHPVPSARR